MISVIMPVLNEAKGLAAVLNALLSQSGDYEVIVVDGGSSDDTVAIAARYLRVRVLHADRGRASQMNVGAGQAQGQLLLFLHADTVLPAGALQSLDEIRDKTAFGGFHQQFSGPGRVLRAISRLHNWRCRRSGVFYGDQAMFVTRSLFKTVNGFPDMPMLEDVALSERLLMHVRPRLIDDYVVTDSRKFEQMGPWRSLWRCAIVLTCYRLRLPILGSRFFLPVR